MTKKDICIIIKENDKKDVWKRALMYKRKSKGPRTEPWGTPHTTDLYVEVWP